MISFLTFLKYRNEALFYFGLTCFIGAMLLDLKIRHETHNAKSLDDVMRALYKDYFQTKNRGFTDAKFRQECERIAGVLLNELFSYETTVQLVDYPKYLTYAGLTIDTAIRPMPVYIWVQPYKRAVLMAA